MGTGLSGSEPKWERRSWCSLSSQAWKATSSLNVALLYTCTERIQRLLDRIGSAQNHTGVARRKFARCTLHVARAITDDDDGPRHTPGFHFETIAISRRVVALQGCTDGRAARVR